MYARSWVLRTLTSVNQRYERRWELSLTLKAENFSMILVLGPASGDVASS
jgi:hypothetical protein